MTPSPTLWPLLAAALLTAPATASAATQAQLDTAWHKGLAWLIKEQNGDGRWQAPVGGEFAVTTAALEALHTAKLKNFSYTHAVTWLNNTTALSTDSQARKIQVLAKVQGASNTKVTALVTSLTGATTWVNSSKTWGAYPLFDTSLPDTPLALLALLAANGTWGFFLHDLCVLAGAQNRTVADPDYGSWSYVAPAGVPGAAPRGALVPTALALAALYKVKTTKNPSGTCAAGLPDVISEYPIILSTAKTWLAARQHADGSYSDEAAQSSPFATAVVYEALVMTALVTGEDPAVTAATATATTAALDYLISRQQPDGSWGDALQTATVLKALKPPTFPSSTLPLKDADNDGVPDLVEPYLGLNHLIADTRALQRSNGSSTLTLVGFSQQADQYQWFSLPIGASGGEAPYVWAVVAGALPPGLNLTASGMIEGTPLALGSFDLRLRATDARGVSATADGRITVLAAAYDQRDSDGDGLPDSYEALHGLNAGSLADAALDADGDSLTNLQEYLLGTDPQRGDTDGDGLPDGYEVDQGFDPLVPTDAALDADGDGLSNLQEYQQGTDPRRVDTDDDGMNDKAEVDVGRNPLVNENAVLLIIQMVLD